MHSLEVGAAKPLCKALGACTLYGDRVHTCMTELSKSNWLPLSLSSNAVHVQHSHSQHWTTDAQEMPNVCDACVGVARLNPRYM